MIFKVLYFALLACTIQQVVPAPVVVDLLGAVRPALAGYEVAFDTLHTVNNLYKSTKVATKDVYDSAAQGVETAWTVGTAPVRFGNKLTEKRRQGTNLIQRLEESVAETLNETENSIANKFTKTLTAGESVINFAHNVSQTKESIDTISSRYESAKAPDRTKFGVIDTKSVLRKIWSGIKEMFAWW